MVQEIKTTQRKTRVKVGRESKKILSEDIAKYNEMENKEERENQVIISEVLQR